MLHTGENWDPMALFHLVHSDGPGQGVGGRDVIVVLVAVAPDESAALVVSRYELEAHTDFAVAKAEPVQHGERPAVAGWVIRNLRQNVRLSARGLVSANFPSRRRPVIGHGNRPARRRLSQ